MNETTGIILCIVAIITGIATMQIAYNIGVNSQRRINKLINDRDKYDGFLKGYKIGYDKGISEKSE